MKVLLDTNVLIDFLSLRDGYSDDAQKILGYCMRYTFTNNISTLTE